MPGPDQETIPDPFAGVGNPDPVPLSALVSDTQPAPAPDAEEVLFEDLVPEPPHPPRARRLGTE